MKEAMSRYSKTFGFHSVKKQTILFRRSIARLGDLMSTTLLRRRIAPTPAPLE